MTSTRPDIAAFANAKGWTFLVVRHGELEGKP
jgi:hypothetical protein